MGIDTITYLLLGLLILASLVAIGYYFTVNVANPFGKGAEKSTARLLNRFGRIRGFRVLSGLRLTVDGESVDIENLLIGYFGILLVHTCGARGDYNGTLESESWSVTVKDGKRTFPNPVLQQQKAASMLRTLFSRNEIYKIQIDQIVALTNPSKNTNLYVVNNGEILLPGKLTGFLGKTRYEKDNGVDVGKLAEVILGSSEPVGAK